MCTAIIKEDGFNIMDGDLFCVAPQLLTRTKARSFQRFLSRTAEQGTQFERQRGKKWLCMIVVWTDGGGQVVSVLTRPVSGSVWGAPTVTGNGHYDHRDYSGHYHHHRHPPSCL